MKHDIVYILRNDINDNIEELRYSLRSIDNLPHGKVWFFGGVPNGLKPDMQIEFPQRGMTVWKKVWNSIEMVCKTSGVSEDFWLFNDDFFVMQLVDDLPPLYDKTLYQRAKQIAKNHGGPSLYSNELMKLREMLTEKHYKSYNYATHTPLLVNKKKALQVIRAYPDEQMFRSLYGNVCNIGGHNVKDCKIVKLDLVPENDAVLLSTSERSFAEGEVGKYIRETFPNPSKYEE